MARKLMWASKLICYTKSIEKHLHDLRKILGNGAVRSLRMRKSVLKVWRRTTPHNWWVENRRGKMLWHSHEREPRPNLYALFELQENSKTRIWTGCPDIMGSDEGAPEQSIFQLKKMFCISKP